MQIEIGGAYKTRSGGRVCIERQEENGDFYGVIWSASGERDRLAYFSPSGQYAMGRPTEFDIVEKATA